MTVDEALEALEAIKKKNPKAGSFEILDEYAEEQLTVFRLSQYDSVGKADVDYVVYETAEFDPDE